MTEKQSQESQDLSTDVLHKEFWHAYAEAFVHPLQTNGQLGKFVSNPNITGAYAEAWVKNLVGSMVPQYKISTGSIIRSMDAFYKRKGLQYDLMIWDPTELPALFAVGDFALVPSFSVRAVIEIKRTSSKTSELVEQLSERRKALPNLYQKYTLGVLVSHPSDPFTYELDTDWVESVPRIGAPPVVRLLDSEGNADVKGILALIYLLSHLGGHRGPLGSMSLRSSKR